MNTREMLEALFALQCAGNDQNSQGMSAKEAMNDYLHGIYDNAAYANEHGKENKEAGRAAVKAAQELIQKGRELKAQGYTLRWGQGYDATLSAPEWEVPGALDRCTHDYGHVATSAQHIQMYLVNTREMTIEEITQVFNVEASTVRRACLNGWLPEGSYRKSGKNWLVKHWAAHERWG